MRAAARSTTTAMNGWLEDAPDPIAELAQRCVTHVHGRLGFELDGTPETLGVLDHFIDDVVREEARGETPPPGHAIRGHLVHLFAPSIGAYFGEVVRARLPARWRDPAKPPSGWSLELEGCYLRFNPAGAAAEAIARDHVADWSGALATAPAETDALHERLAAAPGVPEDEFFMLATRHEVLQIADDWLRQRGAAGGVPARLSAADYDRVLGPPQTRQPDPQGRPLVPGGGEAS